MGTACHVRGEAKLSWKTSNANWKSRRAKPPPTVNSVSNGWPAWAVAPWRRWPLGGARPLQWPICSPARWKGLVLRVQVEKGKSGQGGRQIMTGDAKAQVQAAYGGHCRCGPGARKAEFDESPLAQDSHRHGHLRHLPRARWKPRPRSRRALAGRGYRGPCAYRGLFRPLLCRARWVIIDYPDSGFPPILYPEVTAGKAKMLVKLFLEEGDPPPRA